MNGYEALIKQANLQLEALSNLSPIKEDSLETTLKRHGIDRRDFLKWAASITAMLALPSS